MKTIKEIKTEQYYDEAMVLVFRHNCAKRSGDMKTAKHLRRQIHNFIVRHNMIIKTIYKEIL